VHRQAVVKDQPRRRKFAYAMTVAPKIIEFILTRGREQKASEGK
jgi:hypothetical protein